MQTPDPNAIDLGYITPSASEPMVGKKGARSKPPAPVYPSFHIEGDPAESVIMDGLSPDQIVTATVTMKVVGIHQKGTKSGMNAMYDSGPSVEFEVQSIEIEDAADEASDANEPGENAGSAMDKFRAEKMPAEA